MRWLLVAVLLLATSAAAQGYTLSIDEIPALSLEPKVDIVRVNVPWTLSCNPSTASPAHDGRIVWEPTMADAPGVIVFGNLSAPLQVPSCPGTGATGSSPFEVQVTSDAPGLENITLNWNATANYGVLGPDTGSTSATATSTVEASYVGLVSAKAPKTIFSVPGGSIAEVVVELENLGNRASYVHILEGGVMLMEPVLIARDATEVIAVELTAPRTFLTSAEALYAIDFVPIAEGHPDQAGNTVTVNTLIRSNASPIPFALIGIAVLLGIGVALVKLRSRAQ